jgi:hypothetical protein
MPSTITLYAETFPGSQYRYMFSYRSDVCTPMVRFTIPDDVFGSYTRLLGVDLQTGDSIQRRISQASGIRHVYECSIQAGITPMYIASGEVRVSPDFPLTRDGLEGVIIGSTPPWRTPFGWIYLALRPAAGVRQTLAQGTIYLGGEGRRGTLVFGGQGTTRSVEFVSGQEFRYVDVPFYTVLDTANLAIQTEAPPSPPPRRVNLRVEPKTVTPGGIITISGVALELGQSAPDARVLITVDGQTINVKSNRWGAFSYQLRVSEQWAGRQLVISARWGGGPPTTVTVNVAQSPSEVTPAQNV